MVEFGQKSCLFFNIVSPAVHTLLPSVLQRLNSSGIEAPILILTKNSSTAEYDPIIHLILLPSQVPFYVGEQNISQMVQNQENMEGYQPIQNHSHAQQPWIATTDLCATVQECCPGETGLYSSVFQAVSKKSLVNFQST